MGADKKIKIEPEETEKPFCSRRSGGVQLFKQKLSTCSQKDKLNVIGIAHF